MDRYGKKYSDAPLRLQKWDYGWAAYYFITICTKDRKPYFGEISNCKMKLGPVGILADVLWFEIKNHAQGIKLGEFVVMPNHIHGILILTENNNSILKKRTDRKSAEDPDWPEGSGQSPTGGSGQKPIDGSRPGLTVGSRHALNQQEPLNQINSEQNRENPNQPLTPGQKRFQNQGKNTVSSIVGSYKSAVTKHAHRLGYEFAWQSRFWDNIIRDWASFSRIVQYIKNNPKNWKKDKFGHHGH